VRTSVMDERVLSAMSFIKNCLRAQLTKNLQLFMRATVQYTSLWILSRTALCSRCNGQAPADRYSH
jgi:hypothetical protein